MEVPPDSQVLSQHVRKHLPEALRFATRLTGNPEAAEELVGESLWRAARSWGTFRGQSTFRSWFWRVVINAFRDGLKQRETETLPGDLMDRRGVAPSSTAMANELGQTIARLVSALPPRQREVLVLVSYEGLTVREVATLLEVTEANVHATLHHARNRLRQELAPYLVEM